MNLRSEIRWTLVTVFAGLVLTAAAQGHEPWVEIGLAHRDMLWQGQLWRLLTGPLIHATWGHALRDLSLLVGIAIAFGPVIHRFGILCVLGLCIPTMAVFAWEPAIDVFYGTSGLTHAVLAAAVVGALRNLEKEEFGARVSGYAVVVKPLAVCIAVAFVGKLGYEAVTGMAMFPMDLGAGVRPLPISHLAGAVVGAVLSGIPDRK